MTTAFDTDGHSRRRSPWPRRAVVVAGIAAIIAGAIVAPGFDERTVAPDDPAVWAMQNVDGQRFGRVNTLVGEVDTVKQADAPTDIVQSGDTLLVYTNNLGSVTPVEAARPRDIAATGTEGTTSTPPGTDAVVNSGDYVAYITTEGAVLTGRVSDLTALTPAPVDPFSHVQVAEGDERPTFRAAAVAVSPDGTVAAYSTESQTVVRADAATGAVSGVDEVPDGPTDGAVQVTWVGDTWVLAEPESGRVWLRGVEGPVAVEMGAGAVLQRSAAQASSVVVADDFGIVEVPLDGSEAARTYGSVGTTLGRPAAPTVAPGTGALMGAWLPAGPGPGTLWEANGPVSDLNYGGFTLAEQRSPQLRSNGVRLILNENRTGWVWNVPSGQLVPSSQKWDPEEKSQQVEEEDEVVAEVTDPRPPVAEDDEFGVRAGRQSVLPVLLNDHDANRDVLTIDPATLTQPSPEFGAVTLSDDQQSLVVTTTPGASGTATFTYTVTDGTPNPAQTPRPATVTLTVVPASVNTAPVWCGVPKCLVEWPQPQVNPGGTVAVDALTGWVDPEGDPIYVSSASTTSPTGSVVASPEGKVVFEHIDPNASETGTTAVNVTVSDAMGAWDAKALTVTIMGEPALRADDVAFTVVSGVTTTFEVDKHVRGARGPLELTEASLAPGDDATVAIAKGIPGFTFVADQPGSHLVFYKVSDGTAQARATARVTVLAPEDEHLTTVPLTAFVRAKEDATVDVLATVSNPGGRVLLLNDAAAAPEANAILAADIVGHSALRVSGDTFDGQPGQLGVVRYHVSDGTGRTQGTATGEITVILLPSKVPARPVAVDDAITMRVGTLADISVLRNDIGPAGNVIALDAGSVAAESGGGLAFAAGSAIRYLAPSTPGVHVINYSTYVLGYPLQAASARLVVTVLANDTNAPPTPRDLVGRAANGERLRMPFDGTGIDPDGDAVALTRVVTQPSSGTASVAADGQALIYTADPSASGQVSFTFEVTDERGLTAEATAHVGVVAAEFEARPIVYTDYVQVQAGLGRQAVVTPAANDIDLAGGELTLEEVVPDAPPGTDEHADLARRLVATTDGVVTFDVGEQPGTFAYLYTVSTAQGSTAIGRIILKVVREPVADLPLVADTVLTVDTRASFATGVDVINGKVSWGSGDPSGLVVTLWGEPNGVSVDGWRISGTAPDRGALIPFQVTGPNFAGEEVVSYGFLRIPPVDELRLALKEPYVAPRVNEGESVTFDVKPLVSVPADVVLEIDGEDVKASGARPEATCTVANGTSITYTAGKGAPYTDTCLVSMRAAGQADYTAVPLPIIIVAEAPQPTLIGTTLELSPGASTVFDLGQMVSWPAGADARPVEFAVGTPWQQFEVTRDGTRLTIRAADAAVPGRIEVATVSLQSDPDVRPVSLTLRVGPAPSALPKGASVARQCTQNQGSSCTIDVVGGPGEINPLPGTPLQVVSVTPDPSCPAVSFYVGGTSQVVASWTADAPGAVCQATFAVRDAQGRVSAGDRQGVVLLDLRGYPSGPGQMRQVGYGDGSVTLAVTPSGGTSYPSVTGYAIYDGATKVATCSSSGTCGAITGLRNGAKHSYTARAVNAVGESRRSVAVVAWSYAPPAPPANVTWKPSTNTGGEGLRADIELDITDDTTKELRITSPLGETSVVPVSGRGHRVIPAVIVGANTPQQVTITPLTALDLPPVEGASAQGSAVTIAAHGIGRPTLQTPEPVVAPSGTSVTFTVPVTSGGSGAETWVGILRSGTCESMVRARRGSASLTTDVQPNVAQLFTICGESRLATATFGRAATVDVTVFPFADPGAPDVLRGYRVARTCTGDGSVCSTGITAPLLNPTGLQLLATPYYTIGSGSLQSSFSPPIGAPFTANVRYCVLWSSSTRQCSESSTVIPPDAGWPEYRTQVEVSGCRVGDAPRVSVSALSGDYSLAWTLLDADDQVTSDYHQMRRARVTVSFGGRLNSIAPWTSADQTCTGVPPEPEPEPEPEPDPDPDPDPDPPITEPTP